MLVLSLHCKGTKYFYNSKYIVCFSLFYNFCYDIKVFYKRLFTYKIYIFTYIKSIPGYNMYNIVCHLIIYII